MKINNLIYFIFATIIFLNSKLLNARETSFSWEPIKKASHYKINFCNDQNCTDIFLSENVFDTQYKKNFTPGIYFFSIAAVSQTGKVGVWAKPKKFIVKPKIPILLEPKNKAYINFTTDTLYEFKWEPSPGATSYVLKLIFPNGEEKFFTTSKTSHIQEILTLGKYNWSVKSDSLPSISDDFSEPWEVNFNIKPPRVYNIRNNSTKYIYDSQIEIKWSAIGFSHYKLDIKHQKQGEQEFSQLALLETSQNNHLLKKPPLGYYKINISGTTKNNINVPSKTLSFFLKKRPKLQNLISLDYLIGRPSSSLTKTDPDYISIGNGNFSSLSSFIFGYNNRINNISSSLYILQSFNGNNINLLSIKTKIQYIFEFKSLNIEPGIGFHKIDLESTNENAGDLRLTPHSNFLLAFNLRLNSFLVKNSSIMLQLDSSGFFKTTKYYDLLLQYDYKINNNFNFNTGLFSKKLKGKWIPINTTSEDKRDIEESYSGLKFGFGIIF